MTLIRLPKTAPSLGHPLERLLAQRRTLRAYSGQPVSWAKAACLLWAAQGVTDAGGLRTAPSAGALYPLEVYLLAGAVTGLEPGIYRYQPRSDAVLRLASGDRRAELAAAALHQDWLVDAALTLAFAARYARTTWRYGRRGVQYVHIEVGHAAQNVQLMAVSLGLGSAVVGAFDEARVASLLGLPAEETPLYLLPVGAAA